MDLGIEDPASFMGSFRRNDQETIHLMAKAAKIVPKVCDILGISLSDSESEVEDDADDTAVERDERSSTQPLSHHQEGEVDAIIETSALGRHIGEDISDDGDDSAIADTHQVQEGRPKSNFRARWQGPTRASGLEVALGSHVRKSRKRCASTPSALSSGQSASTNPSEGLRGLIPPPHKKRRFPSISISGLGSDSNANQSGGSASGLLGDFQHNSYPAWGNQTPGEFAIRRKMMEEFELLQEQLNKLAEMEKQQYALMQRYIEIVKGQPTWMVQPEQALESAAATTTTTDRDGTNELRTATATTDGEEFGFEERREDEVTEEPVVSMDVMNLGENAEIFTDADLQVGAEEVIDGASAEGNEELGSMM